MMYIYLDLSTGHLTDETRETLGRLTAADRFYCGWPAMTVAQYDYGFFITVPDAMTEPDQMLALPDDLCNVLQFAAQLGAAVVRLDADGPALSGLD